jgi:hypothetical protein
MNFYHHDAINEAMTGSWTHTFSPTFLNEARVNAAAGVGTKSTRAMGLAHGQLRQYRIRESAKYRRSRTSVFDQWTYGAGDTLTKVINAFHVSAGTGFVGEPIPNR